MYKLMTSGPTMVRENVLAERSKPFTNPDIDADFFDKYHEICLRLSKIANTRSEAIIMGGEGILGLEAACASLTEKGDRVLVIDNGIFGRGFEGFVKLYGGEPHLLTFDYRRPVDANILKNFLEKDHDFKYATLVHVDTPTGVVNDISELCAILKSYGIITVVDSVAGLFGEFVSMDASKIDVLCGGSQKALSAPPGLAMVWISDDGWKVMENRNHPITAYYANLLLYRDYYVKKSFPYTMPISDIMALGVALENVEKDRDILRRHREIAMACRQTLTRAGLTLFLEEGWANTVTAFILPKSIEEHQLLKVMKEDYNILISGSLEEFSGKLMRIGHMGENATIGNVTMTLKAIQDAMEKLGYKLDGDMAGHFTKLMA